MLQFQHYNFILCMLKQRNELKIAIEFKFQNKKIKKE